MLEPVASKRILLTINKRAHEISPLVVRVKANIAQRMQNIKFVCSDGTGFSDHRPRTTLFISVVVQKDGKTQMGFGSRMYQRGAEFITPELIEELLQETVRQAIFLFDTFIADLLTELTGEDALASADEVSLEDMADGFVHQYAATACSQDNRHLATCYLPGIK